MTLDHVNTYFLGSRPDLYAVGRLAFPLFACVFGFKIGRPAPDKPVGQQRRTMLMLLTAAAAAQLPYAYLHGGGPWPLNVMGLFLVALCAAWWWHPGQHAPRGDRRLGDRRGVGGRLRSSFGSGWPWCWPLAPLPSGRPHSRSAAGRGDREPSDSERQRLGACLFANRVRRRPAGGHRTASSDNSRILLRVLPRTSGGLSRRSFSFVIADRKGESY